MKVLAVYLNGQRLCLAGLGDDGHVSADVTWFGDGADGGFAQVGGFDGARDEHVKWAFRQLRVGDEVRVVIEEVTAADAPNERKTVEEMDRWARSLRPTDPPQGQQVPPLPAPWE